MNKKDAIIAIKKCRNVEEVISLAKTNNVQISEKEAQEIFNKTHLDTKLSDEELSNVNGGCGGVPPFYDRLDYVEFNSEAEVSYLFKEGDTIQIGEQDSRGWSVTNTTIISRKAMCNPQNGKWYDCYNVKYSGNNLKYNLKRSDFIKSVFA